MASLALPPYTDPAVRAEAVASARLRRIAPEILASFGCSTPAQSASLAALAEGTCVVTGQQAGLFGGPLYTLHKAASAIVDARALQAETGVPCAPVFWLQDEDHDFDEIAVATLIDPAGELREARVAGVAGEDGRSVGARRLGSVADALETLATAVHGAPHADEVLALLTGAHGPDVTPSDAFIAGIERLFAPHGLLVLRPRHPAVIEAARSVHARAVAQAGPIAAAIPPGPVHVRPGSPLSFLHPEGLDGPRYRVAPAEDRWRLCKTDRTVSAAELAAGPHSTSVLLRPILQDALLPTAAYVGGPGEIAYLAQMTPVWGAFDLPIPLIVPRARLVLVDAVSRRLLDGLALSIADLAAPREALLARLATARGDLPDPEALRTAVVGPALEALAAFAPGAAALEAGLGKSVAKTSATLHDAVGRLVERYRRALAGADEVTVTRLDRVLARLAPGGLPQERVHAWPPYGARLGIDALVDRIVASVVPFDGALREVAI